MTLTGNGAAPRLAVLDVADLDVLADAVDALPIRVDRLSAGPGGIELARLALDGITVTTGRTAASIRSEGATERGHVVLGLQLGPGEGHWNGTPFDPHALWSYPEGTEHHGVGAVTPWWAAITIDTDVVGVPALTDQESDGATVVRGPAIARLAATVRAATGERQLDLAPAQREALAASIVDLAGEALAGEPQPISTRAAARIVAQCDAIYRDHRAIPRVTALAERLGVSDRWIRAAFEEHCGVTPSTYFRARALNAARRELRDAAPGSTTITAVGSRRGFWHLGRFAGEYRRLFGEPPSATLLRPPENGSSPARLPDADSSLAGEPPKVAP